MSKNISKLGVVLGNAINELRDKIIAIKPYLVSDKVEDKTKLIDLTFGGVDDEFITTLANDDDIEYVIEYLEKFNESSKSFVSDWTFNYNSEFLIDYEKIIDDFRVGLVYTISISEDRDVVYTLILNKITEKDIEVLHTVSKVRGEVVEREANTIKNAIYLGISKVYDFEQSLSEYTVHVFEERLMNLLTNLKYGDYVIYDVLKRHQDFKANITTYDSYIDDNIIEKIVLDNEFLVAEIIIARDQHRENIRFELKNKSGEVIDTFEVNTDREDD